MLLCCTSNLDISANNQLHHPKRKRIRTMPKRKRTRTMPKRKRTPKLQDCGLSLDQFRYAYQAWGNAPLSRRAQDGLKIMGRCGCSTCINRVKIREVCHGRSGPYECPVFNERMRLVRVLLGSKGNEDVARIVLSFVHDTEDDKGPTTPRKRRNLPRRG